jgi:hypothetical protein|nr:MAG TPA: zinc-ribbon protein [Crassvirales sp.]
MDNLQVEVKPIELEIPKEEFNNIPTLYCKHCLSLVIMNMDGTDYCDKCGGTDIGEAHIHDWEKMYEQKYGEKLLK